MTPAFDLQAQLRMGVGGQDFGGSRRIALLHAIGEHGSITQGAKAVGLSYKAAWDAVDAMNNLAGEPLVVRSPGGKGGGGTTLTERGKQLVEGFQLMEDAQRRFVAQLAQHPQGSPAQMALLQRISSLKTSARNQFFGKVSRITSGAVNDEVELEIAPGQLLVAIITHESAEQLGLAVDSEAFALVKASSILLATGSAPLKLSARNQLTGQVVRITPGAVNCEVVIELTGSITVAAIVTQASAQSMGLQLGCTASAIFKASSVIVGVPA
ncbi:MAG: TOBE domain-containing protein [Burkholderiales bacterium]